MFMKDSRKYGIEKYTKLKRQQIRRKQNISKTKIYFGSKTGTKL